LIKNHKEDTRGALNEWFEVCHPLLLTDLKATTTTKTR
jgi:hypothetical protein